MNEFLMCDCQIACKQIFEDYQSLGFLEGSSCFYSILQIPAFTKFCDDVAVVNSRENIMASDDVRMFQLLKCLNLEPELILECRIGFFIPEIDNFDGDSFFRVFVDALKNILLAIEVDMVTESIRIILYFFTQLISMFPMHNK